MVEIFFLTLKHHYKTAIRIVQADAVIRHIKC